MGLMKVSCVSLAVNMEDGAGSYLYVDSALQREGDVARIITQQEFPASSGVCHLRFWFHMYGSQQMGTLKVRKKKDVKGRAGSVDLNWKIKSIIFRQTELKTLNKQLQIDRSLSPHPLYLFINSSL